ncbi:MAG: rRNA pseudouridine synthase [Oscillospiraceae bacterium]|nr:rRNA pseudouridine synthase [Oscillospiraceae bacterium]
MVERVSKIISSYGLASRRAADKMISEGRVQVNGVVITLGQQANPEEDLIEIDGAALGKKPSLLYIMLNKPLGYVCTMNDEKGRKTVISLLDDVEVRVYPVGRLDINSSGLLLLTNDGSFANRMMHPSNMIEKTYELSVTGDIKRAVRLLKLPMEIDNSTVQAISVKTINSNENSGILQITIREGRNRQIRKMCALSDLQVRSLKRISVGELMLGSLKTGKWRYLDKNELELLDKSHNS